MKCSTSGAPAGEIIFNKTDIHLVTFNEGKELRLGVVIKVPTNLSVKCLNMVWNGSIMASVDGLKSLEKAKAVKFLFHQKTGRQELSECELDKEFCFEGKAHKSFLLELRLGPPEEKVLDIGVERETKSPFPKNSNSTSRPGRGAKRG